MEVNKNVLLFDQEASYLDKKDAFENDLSSIKLAKS